MDIWNNNLKNLQKNHKEIYEYMKNCKNEEETDIKQISKFHGSYAGEGIIVNKNNEVFRLNSSYSPIHEVQRWVKQYSFINKDQLFYMFGLGNGYFVREILSKFKTEDKIYIYEPSIELFRFVLQNFDISDLIEDDRCYIAVEGINEKKFHLLLYGSVTVMNIKTGIECKHPNYNTMFPESCKKFLEEVKDALCNAIVNMNTEIYFCELHSKNICHNLKYLRNISTLKELKEVLPKDTTAILVAAGPSVEENIEMLRKAKGRTIIFAVDRILDFLLDHGIEPDFVLALDAEKGLEFFTRRKEIKVPLIHFLSSNVDVMDIQTGKKILCYSNDILNDIFRNMNKFLPEILSSPSVATIGFSVIAVLGINRVIFVGQDLAFAANGQSHTGDIQEDVSNQNVECYVEGIDGEKVRSRYDWRTFVRWYEDALNRYSDIEAIDVKKSGAKIPGTINLSFAEALESCTDSTIWNKEKEEKIAQAFSEEEWKEVIDQLQGKVKDLGVIRKKCIDGMKKADKLILYCKKHVSMDAANRKLTKELNQMINDIQKKPVIKVLERHITALATSTLWDINCFSDDLKNDSIKTYNHVKNMLRAIKEGIDFLKPLMEIEVNQLAETEGDE